MPSDDLARLLRWEEAGATWQLLATRGTSVTVSLCRCDGGEEVEQLVSDEPDLRQYVSATDR
jgi:hypothetical protein